MSCHQMSVYGVSLRSGRGKVRLVGAERGKEGGGRQDSVLE